MAASIYADRVAVCKPTVPLRAATHTGRAIARTKPIRRMIWKTIL
jgi:hypothetical protein